MSRLVLQLVSQLVLRSELVSRLTVRSELVSQLVGFLFGGGSRLTCPIGNGWKRGWTIVAVT